MLLVCSVPLVCRAPQPRPFRGAPWPGGSGSSENRCPEPRPVPWSGASWREESNSETEGRGGKREIEVLSPSRLVALWCPQEMLRISFGNSSVPRDLRDTFTPCRRPCRASIGDDACVRTIEVLLLGELGALEEEPDQATLHLPEARDDRASMPSDGWRARGVRDNRGRQGSRRCKNLSERLGTTRATSVPKTCQRHAERHAGRTLGPRKKRAFAPLDRRRAYAYPFRFVDAGTSRPSRLTASRTSER